MIGQQRQQWIECRAQPGLTFIPPRLNRGVLWFAYAVLPLLLRVRLRRWLPAGIWPIVCDNPDPLVQCFQQFQAGEIRLLLAFRHSQVDDPLVMGYLFSRILPQAARRLGITLRSPLHTAFMYDRGMTLWAGRWLGWFFSCLGGVPVRRGRQMDLKALKTLRAYLYQGEFPLTIAPEGATNGHSDRVSPLEPGTAQLAFWGVEDLHKAGQSQPLLIVPIGLRYGYPHPNWSALDRLLSQLERDTGLPLAPFAHPHTAPLTAYYQRLCHLGEHLLTRMEQFYQRFYPAHVSVPERSTAVAASTEWAAGEGELSSDGKEIKEINEGGTIAQRLAQVLEAALRVGESYFGLPSQGSLASRCRRLEEAGWTQIYRDDLGSLADLSPLERGLADWSATTASLYLHHMRLVESFVAVTDHYVRDRLCFERLAETTLILFDLVERVKGVTIPRRPQLGQRQAVFTIGTPIDVSQRWPCYARDRRSAKAAVATLTADLQAALEALIP